MLVFGNKLSNLAIIALANGGQIAHTVKPIIDLATLKVVALHCRTGQRQELVLMTADIREFNGQLILVNSEDDLIEATDVIRLQPLLEQDFRLLGVAVKTEGGTNLGKVSEYAFESKSFVIQKLHVKPALIKQILTNRLVIDRSQVVDVNPEVITVRDVSVTQPLPVTTPVTTE